MSSARITGAHTAKGRHLAGWAPVSYSLPPPATPVLAVRGSKVLRVVYAPKFTLSSYSFGEFQPEGEYDPLTNTTYWPEGWYEWNEYEETHWALDSAPSHWQPLPDLPL
jgi:hypothetical protein